MKKNLIAAALVVALTSGCSMMGGGEDGLSVKEVNLRATELNAQPYQKSKITSAEVLRNSINDLYMESMPILNDYEKRLSNYELGAQLQGLRAMEVAENGDEAGATLMEAYKNGEVEGVEKEDALKMYKDYEAMINDSFILDTTMRIGEVVVKLLVELDKFSKMDQSAMLSEVDFSDLSYEKDRFSVTGDQLSIMSDGFSTIMDEYNANKAAGLIK